MSKDTPENKTRLKTKIKRCDSCGNKIKYEDCYIEHDTGFVFHEKCFPYSYCSFCKEKVRIDSNFTVDDEGNISHYECVINSGCKILDDEKLLEKCSKKSNQFYFN